MSEVFKGIDPALERHVAIKIMLGSGSQENMVNFLEEARAIASLRHTNIVPLYSAGDENGMPYIAMGFIEGSTLEEWIAAKKTIMNFERAMWFMTQAVAALEYAARSNIIHLDVKPANFMVDTDDVVMLTDFGLARKLSELHAGLRSGEELQGTPAYASPEHILQRQPDLRTDIYCLGASLYHFMTGQFPYPGESTEEVCRQHIERDFPIQTLIQLGVPRGWSAMIQKMMAKAPEDRFQTYEEITDVLNNIDHYQGDETISMAGRALPRSGGSPENMFGMIPNEMLEQGDYTFAAGDPLEDGAVYKLLDNRWPVLSLNALVDELKALARADRGDIRDLMVVLKEVPSFQKTLTVLSEFIAFITEERPQSDAEKIELVGIERCSNLALISIALQRPWQGACPFNCQNFWHHQVYTGIIAEFLVEMLGLPSTGQEFFAGVIHDIGKLVLLELYPSDTMVVWADAIEQNVDVAEVESEYFGVNHAQVGFEWLRRNKFNKQICYLTAYHADPLNCYSSMMSSSSLRVTSLFGGVREESLTIQASVVASANVIVKELGLGYSGNPLLDQTPWIEQQLTLDLFEARTKEDVTLEDLDQFFFKTCQDLPDLPIMELASHAQAEKLRQEAIEKRTREVI